MINDNLILNHDFDFNNSDLLRNTLPYLVDEEFGDNDFITESNETIRQITKIESITKGDIDDITVLDGGDGYKVGDLAVFDNTDTNGSGFSAKVDEIVGIGVSRIDTTLQKFENVVFTWKDNDNVGVTTLPFIELNDQTSISVSGLSTSVLNLTGSFKIGVSTDTIGLAKTMALGNSNGVIQDIYVTDIPNTVSIGGSLRIGSETLKVLNLYDVQKVIKVQRGAGIAHTSGSQIEVSNSKINIPVKTKKFDSKINDLVYFNGPQSVGVGTTSGGATQVKYFIGELVKDLSIPTRSIHVPNHPFKTGQKVTLVKDNNASRFDVGRTPNVTEFKVPHVGQNSLDVYIINKGEDYVGIVNSKVGIGSTSEGLYVLFKWINRWNFIWIIYFSSNHEQ